MTNSTSTGPGRLIITVYAVLALAATGRSLYQLIAKYEDAPLAYFLSAVAAIVYCIATWSLATHNRLIAHLSISFELCGVLAIGTWSTMEPDIFPEPTVWSEFGSGYLWVPLVLPVIGLWWLRRSEALSGPA